MSSTNSPIFTMPPRNPSRVLFYGVTGSGKSSAARAYAEAACLPEYSVDDCIGWLPGWEQRDAAEQLALSASIAAEDRWVLDSAYSGWRDLVMARAELIVALDYPRWLSLSRLVRRTVRRILTRQVVCNGNRETLARALARDSVIYWHFQTFARKRRVIRDMQAGRDHSLERDARIIRDMQAGRDPQAERNAAEVIVFRRPRDLDAWLAGVGAAPGGSKASEATPPLRA